MWSMNSERNVIATSNLVEIFRIARTLDILIFGQIGERSLSYRPFEIYPATLTDQKTVLTAGLWDFRNVALQQNYFG